MIFLTSIWFFVFLLDCRCKEVPETLVLQILPFPEESQPFPIINGIGDMHFFLILFRFEKSLFYLRVFSFTQATREFREVMHICYANDNRNKWTLQYLPYVYSYSPEVNSLFVVTACHYVYACHHLN